MQSVESVNRAKRRKAFLGRGKEMKKELAVRYPSHSMGDVKQLVKYTELLGESWVRVTRVQDVRRTT